MDSPSPGNFAATVAASALAGGCWCLWWVLVACCPLPVPKSLAGNFSWSAAVRCGKPRRWWLIQFLPLISSSSFAMAAFAGAAIAAAVAASFAASLCL